WPMNPSAMYQALPDRIDPHPVMLTGISPVNLPSHLTVHGPYSLNPTHIQVLNSGACIPFVSPFGDAVMLHVTRVDSISRDTRYVVRADPERVLFYTITWEQNGWRYRIAGRFPANYLLDLAREITVSA
ncbi:MAG TPA: hypothetical protein PLV45_19300, partial [bacterium]|nr:hypothetical protein [bacterium]